MKTFFKYSYIICCLLMLMACKKGWLDRKPRNLVLENQVWNDPKQIVGLLANFYDRIPTDMGLVDIANNAIDIAQSRQAQWRNMADYDDAMWSGYSGEDGRNNIPAYGFDRWRLWNYSLIRDINLSLENIQKFGEKLSDAQKAQFSAELRFIRAYNYFELVRRMGGVPLITQTLIYDYSGDASALQHPRAKEHEVYDFVASECDAILETIGNVHPQNGAPSVSRANRFTALALKCRAMLYAGSLAKYNAPFPNLTTAGGEVGIPASMANGYYQKALDAAKLILTSGKYALHNPDNPNRGDVFYDAVCRKPGNKEVIFAWDYLSSKNKRHLFSYDNIARGIREDNLASSCVTPSLNLVEKYEYLDGTEGTLKTNEPGGDFIYYTNPQDIFANKDGRMAGTILFPGSSFKGLTVEMQAGIMVWNSTTSKYQTIEGSGVPSIWDPNQGGDGKLLIAASGPHRSLQEVSNTGFYLRKYIDAGGSTSTRGIQSDMWWVWFRLGEIYLNAAEAAFELNLKSEAVGYINTLRQRAGFPANSLTEADLTLDRLRNERRVELAFEDHRVWDLKRWRIAHEVWDGSGSNPEANVFALYPYRIVRPGDAARHGKYVYVKLLAPRFRAPRYFQMPNYYSSIDQSVLNNNPKIVRNPLH
jgi:hypothetical protein